MADVLTIRATAARAKAEGIPVSEYTIRQWVRTGALRALPAGKKQLIYYPNFENFLKCQDGGNNQPATVAADGIRRVEK